MASGRVPISMRTDFTGDLASSFAECSRLAETSGSPCPQSSTPMRLEEKVCFVLPHTKQSGFSSAVSSAVLPFSATQANNPQKERQLHLYTQYVIEK